MTESKSKPDGPSPDKDASGDAERTLSGNLYAPQSNSQTESFSPNEVLAGRFQVIRFIARGGMGEVYEALDTELNERVALKTVRFELAHRDQAMERFRREIQYARRVTHPNVCRTFDVFRHSETDADRNVRETLIVSMELLSGEALDHRIRRQGRLSTEEALPLIEQMAAGLQAAHQAGVVHRDFKSSNVMLIGATLGGRGVRAVVTDFGLAHAAIHGGESLTGSLDVVGTPAYMAPEQLNGEGITPATDIYALGIVIFEMVTGKLPFSGESALSTALKRLTSPAPSPRTIVPGLEPRWEATVLRCLERLPADRFTNVEEVARAVRGEAVTPRRKQASNSWKRWPLVVGGSLLLLVGGWGGYYGLKARSRGTTQLANDTSMSNGQSRTSVAVWGFQDLSDAKSPNLLGELLAESLWSQLDTDELRFIAPREVDDMKKNLGLREEASPSKEQLAKIGQYLGCDVLVLGSYLRDASAKPVKVEWNTHLVRIKDGGSLGSVRRTGTESEISAMAASAGRLLRTQLGVELSPAEEARIDASLSSNSAALRYFSEAREKQKAFDVLGAAKLLEKAVAEDPKFVQAHSALAEAWSDLGFETKAEEEAKKALDLAAQLSPEGRGLVTGRHYEMARDWDKAIQQYAQLWTLHSDDPEYALLLAKSQSSGGKAQAALTTLQQIRGRALLSGLAARVDLATAEAQDALANHQEQLVAATAAAEKAQAMNAGLMLARARIHQCWALLNTGHADRAKPLCEEARSLNQKAGDPLGTARATNNVANAYWKAGDSASAKPLYEQALSIAQSIGDKLDEAGALNNLAIILDEHGDLDGAKKAYRQSIDVARERGDKNGMGLAEQNLGVIYYRQGDRKNGAETFGVAIRLAHEIGDKETEARALNNLCAFSLQAGELERADKSCQESLKLRRETGDRGDLARSLVNGGDVLKARGNLPAAKQSYEQALKIHEDLGQKGEAAYLQISLASLALEENRAGDAKKLAEAGAGELATQKDPGGEGQGRAVVAQALLASGDSAESQHQNREALRLAEQAGDKVLQLETGITDAKATAMGGNPAAGLAKLKTVEQEARKAGLLLVEFEARLAIGELQMKSGKSAEGRATLRALAQQAKTRGFGLLAKKAAAID